MKAALINDIQLLGTVTFAILFASALLIGRLPPPRHILRTLTLWILLILAAVASLNYFVNPLGLYPTHFIQPIILTSRVDKVRLLNMRDPIPQIVIMGSSRSFTMPPANIQQITGQPAFNASFEGGYPLDYLAFAQYAIQTGKSPSVFIVGLGLEQLQQSYGADEPTNPLVAYIGDVSPVDQILIAGGQFLELFSFDQTDATSRALALEVLGRGTPHYVFDADGLGHFYQPDTLEAAVDKYINLPGWNTPPTQLTDENIEYLAKFLQVCQQHHIFVIFYLPPYHPRITAFYEQSPGFVALKKRILALFASWQQQYKYQFTVYDFLHVDSFSGDATMFVDGVHPSEAAARLMLDVMLHDLSRSKPGNVF